MECWSPGGMPYSRCFIASLLHHSIFIHHSITPTLHHSTSTHDYSRKNYLNCPASGRRWLRRLSLVGQDRAAKPPAKSVDRRGQGETTNRRRQEGAHGYSALNWDERGHLGRTFRNSGGDCHERL